MSSVPKPVKAAHSRALFDAVPEPLWVVRLSDLKLVRVNDAATERFGYSRERFLNMHLGDLHSPEDTARLLESAETRDTSSTGLRGWRTKRADGQNIDTDLSVRFLDFEGEECALICVLDMTARKTLEERLRQAGKMEAIGMLAGGIAHDFNNLLTIISGYSQLLMTGVSDADRTSLEQVLKASEKAAQLTGQLLAFSRRQELQPQLLDMNRIIEGMSTMLRRLIGEHIELRLALTPDLGAIYSDPGHIDQVIMNLVVNARDALTQGGHLIIETANVDLSEDFAWRCLGVPPGSYVMLAVIDNGIGMDSRTRARVFDPFFTTKEPGRGTGLGLSTVYGIVKQANGTVDLVSEPQRGTSVKVYFPRVGNTVQPDAPVEHEFSEGDSDGETILVVEDEDAVRRLVRATLERSGYRVLVAESGADALRIVRETPHIDLLVTDLVMPEMSGVQVAERLREIHPAIQLLFMSGYTDRSIQRTDALSQETEFLQKPFTPAVLISKVREILGRANGGNTMTSGSVQ
ncbi:response regulator [Nevskia soli]|jgi:PAS domain S-box-containing protein|uniref:response regulator n=1 Tax=Nevskia soli TaxID=418856 RepID=UPI0015D6DE4A|nr:response regulator [Nevskia soli]